MSNLWSNIGFLVTSEQEFADLADRAAPLATSVPVPGNRCKYLWYHDKSGAELWMQIDADGQLIGMKPHFHGESRRRVGLLAALTNAKHKLDGRFSGWANPADEDDPESGDYPLEFDAPDFLAIPEFPFPHTVTVQLAAFPSEFYCYKSAETFRSKQEGITKLAAPSFIPWGLFRPESKDTPPQAMPCFSGEVKAFANKTNALTGQPFVWMLIETFGGEVDIVVDPRHLTAPLANGNIVQGRFWYSGRLIL
jgi:hypothetical protein